MTEKTVLLLRTFAYTNKYSINYPTNLYFMTGISFLSV